MNQDSPQQPDGPVSWNPPIPGSSWNPSPADLSVPLAPPEYAAPVESPAVGRGKRLGLLAGVGALVAAGTFAVSQIAGGADGGGSSPQDAVQKLAGALNDEDALGALDVMLPGERRTFRQPMMDLVAELTRLEVLDTSAALDGVEGVDLEITLDEDLDENEVADDIVTVDATGEVSIRVDNEDLPLGSFIIDELMDGERPSGTERERDSLESGDGPLPITTVRRDGRWYVSIFYSIAETARRGTGERVPAAEDGIQPEGAESAEAAVEQMMEAITELDLERMIATLNPNEFEALQRYAPIFLPDAQDSLDELDVRIRINDLDLRSESRGDNRAAVGFDAFDIEATGDGESGTLTWDGDCLEYQLDSDRGKACVGDDTDQAEMEQVVVAQIAEGLADSDPVLAEKVDGKWYVSVMGAGLQGMVDALERIDQNDLQDALDGIEEIFDDLGGLGDVTSEDWPGDLGVDPGDVFGGGDGDIIPPPFDDEQAAADECWGLESGAEALDCFQTGLAAGTIDPAFVPSQMRYPECGLAEAWWVFYAGMSDVEFTTLVESAAACFADKVALGELTPDELPYETLDPSCFGGVNPYAIPVDESEAAFEAYDECLNG